MVNPYEPPAYTPPPVTGLRDNTFENLRKVAFCQKGVMVCLTVYLAIIVAAALFASLEPEISLRWVNEVLVILALVDVLAGTIFVFRLSALVYGLIPGILMGLLTLIPCFGLFLLVLTNGIATARLRQNGIAVGFLGASLSQFARPPLDESL